MSSSDFFYVKTSNSALKAFAHKVSRQDAYKVPNLWRNRELLRRWGYQIEEPETREVPQILHPCAPSLYPYQAQKVRQLLSSTLPGSFLYLTPGLGKGIVSIIAAESNTENRRILVVCPRSLMQSVWDEERRKWSKWPDEWNFHTTPQKQVETRWTVVSYHSLVRNIKKYGEYDWDLVILDESIMVCNRDTTFFKAVEKLHRQKLWCLSGNPQRQNYGDWWAQMHLIFPDGFPSYWKWVMEYCYTMQNAWNGIDIIRDREERDPVTDYPDLIFRTTQKEVLPDLPEYLSRTITCIPNSWQAGVIKQMKKDFRASLSTGEISIPNKLALLTRLQQITSSPANLDSGGTGGAKHDAILDLFESQAVSLPAIIWFQWVPGARFLYHNLQRNFPKLRLGFVSGEDKSQIEQFKRGEIDVMLLSLGVGRYGHTFTNAYTAIYLDRNFSADDYLQSLHRIRRIGLDHVPYLVTLYSPKTSDTLVRQILAGKLTSIEKLSGEEILFLLDNEVLNE